MTSALRSPGPGATHWPIRVLKIAIPVLILVAVVLGTKVVSDNSSLAAGPLTFSAATFGRDNFSKVQAAIGKRAVPASVLAAALHSSQAAAVKKYGQAVPGAPGSELSVRFTGVAGAPADGIYPVKVAGLPKDLILRVQTGPGISGTDLRDATGMFPFGRFTDQIDYENAAAALNTEMKHDVLGKVNAAHLQGKTVTVVGAFELINPDGWLVTPAKLSAS